MDGREGSISPVPVTIVEDPVYCERRVSDDARDVGFVDTTPFQLGAEHTDDVTDAPIKLPGWAREGARTL